MRRVRISMMAAGACTLIAFGAGACGDVTENGDPDKNDKGGDAQNAAEVHDDPAALDGRTFVSTEISTKGELPGYLEKTNVELSFEKNARRISGGVGCNGMFGEVSANDGTLSMDGVGRTEMACQEPLMKQENWLVDLLESSPSWELTEDDQLRIRSDGTELVLAEEKENKPENHPDALRDATWKLDGVSEAGDDPDGTARHSRAMEKTELTFAAPRGEGPGGGRDDGQEGSRGNGQNGQDGRDGQNGQNGQDGRKGQQPSGPGGELARVQGDSGCNQFGGRVTIMPGPESPDSPQSPSSPDGKDGQDGQDGKDSQESSEYDGTIQFEKLTSTMKACANEEITQVEKEMLDTMKGDVPYTLTEDSLTLHGDEYELTFSAH